MIALPGKHASLWMTGFRRERPFLPTRGYKSSIFSYMIRKLQSGEYRLYSRKKDTKTGKRKNLGTFASRVAAEKHERAVQYFKRAY
jgi:hypothetical protein